MKKLFLILFVFIAYNISAQPGLLLKVDSTSQPFGQKVAKGTFIFDKSTNSLWSLDSLFAKTKAISTVTGKTIVGGYIMGTGVTKSGNTLSGTYTGGTGISITGNTITNSAAGTLTYDAGAGITLSTTTFSHTAHSGDATGATTLSVVALQGRAVATTVPTTNTVLYWNGSAVTYGQPYIAGTGIALSANTISGNYTAGTGISISTNTISGNYTAGNGITISTNTISGSYTGGTGILVSSNTISIYYDTLTHVKAGRDLYKNAKYIFTSGGKSGIGTVSAANLAGDSVDYAMFVFNKWGRVTFIASTARFDTLGTASKLIMNDTNIAGTYSTYIKNNLGVFRRFTIEYTYKPY